MEEPLEEDASEHVEKMSAGGSGLVREISFFKVRKLVRMIYQVSHNWGNKDGMHLG